MVANSSIKPLIDCDIVKYWGNIIEVRRLLKREDDLYLDELYMVATIYRLSVIKGSEVNLKELSKGFNIIASRRLYMLDNLIKKGFVVNMAEGTRKLNRRVFRLSVTPLGEQLLNKYRKFLLKLIEGV